MSRNRKVAPEAPSTTTHAAASTKLGQLVDGSAPGALLVDCEGSGPTAARATIALDPSTIAHAIATRQGVLLLFENGDPRLPIVVGLLQPEPGAALLAALLAPTAEGRPGKPTVEARLDGNRVVLEGKDEVTLKCGDAMITLRRDGKIILRGAYIETTAKGVNRIRGGSVKIN